MTELQKPKQRVALTLWTSLALCMCVSAAQADDPQHSPPAAETAKHKTKAKAKKEAAPPPSAAKAADDGAPKAPPAPAPQEVQEEAVCKLLEPEQPRGGKIDVLGDRFGSAPVVRIAGKPARILIRKQDRISVQVPADSNGGEITLLNDGKVASCGTLVIIGKNR
jgi:hypothetical protein